jgi:hypothetical protein
MGRQRLERALQPALLALICASPALAQQRANTQIEVWEIRATTSNSEISPELVSIASDLKKRFRYTGFKVVGRHSGRAELDETFTARLTAHYTVKVTPTNRGEGRIQMKVEIKRLGVKNKHNSVVTVPRGDMQFWGFEYPRSDDAMIIGIRAR